MVPGSPKRVICAAIVCYPGCGLKQSSFSVSQPDKGQQQLASLLCGKRVFSFIFLPWSTSSNPFISATEQVAELRGLLF